jgi:hypothetical protein
MKNKNPGPLERKKNLKLRITDWPENENITDEIRLKILKDRREINHYYDIALIHLKK